MYAVYNCKAASTASQVLSDIAAILSGTTNPASLSASCVTANTSITATDAAGWSVYDAAASATSQVLRVLDQGGAVYKYLEVKLTSSTACVLNAYESWNSGTHVGTNAAVGASSVWDAAGGGYFYIYATAKNVVIAPWTSGGYQTPMACMEFSRDIIPAAYPCFGVVNGAAQIGLMGGESLIMPRIKSANAAGDTLGSSGVAGLGLGPLTVLAGNINTNWGAADGRYRDSAEAVYYAVSRLGIANGTNTGTGRGAITYGIGYDLFVGGNSLLSNLDEVVYGGVNYVCLKTTFPCALLLPKK